MKNHPTYQEYKALKIEPEDITGTRTRRNYLRSIGPENIVSLNNHVVNLILERGTISEDQVQLLRDIESVIDAASGEGFIREDGGAYMVEHNFGITLHGEYLGPKKLKGYSTVVRLKVEKVLTSSGASL